MIQCHDKAELQLYDQVLDIQTNVCLIHYDEIKNERKWEIRLVKH